MTTDSDPASESAQDFIGQLLAPERYRSNDPLEIIGFSEIGDADTVADIGCGPGYFALPLAGVLTHGRLYALDIDEEMLAVCRERLAEAGMSNAEALRCGEFDFPLEQRSLDGALVAFVVQASADPPRFLRAVRELMRPGGWCAILEWYHKETENGPPLERRIDPEDLAEIAQQAGFRYNNRRDLNGEQYMLSLKNQ